MQTLLVRDIRAEHGPAWGEAVEYVLNTFSRRFRDVEDKLAVALEKALPAWSDKGGANPTTLLVKAFLWANGAMEAKASRQKRGDGEQLTSLNALVSDGEGDETELSA